MTLQFEGEAVDAGAMNVRQLAPALIAAADVIRDAHFLLGVPGRSPQVELQATAPGSVIFHLLVTDPYALQQQATAMLTSPSVTATANLSALVGAVVGSIGAVKKLAGRAIAVIQPIAPGRTRVDLKDGSSIEMSQESAQLVNDPAYRRSVRGMVEPLAGNRGIHSLTVSTDGQAETIMTDDYPSFVTAPAAKDDAKPALDQLGSAPGVEDGTIPVSQPQLAVAKAEDPRERIDHSYQRQLELLQEVHQAVADVATSRKRVELQMNQLQKSADKLERQARDSLAVRREDLAREALTRKAAVSDQLNDLQTQYTSFQNAEERITAASQRLQSRVDAFRAKKEVIKALLAAAQAETRINEALTGISKEMGDVGIANQQAEDRTEQTKARASAIDELLASGALDDAVGGRPDDIQAELNQMDTGHDVEAELARLKAERGQSAPAQNEARSLLESPHRSGRNPHPVHQRQEGLHRRHQRENLVSRSAMAPVPDPGNWNIEGSHDRGR